jgi:BirA family biotin operon repressor/biotin-[acetyl-CoA-carboxylase] ligase
MPSSTSILLALLSDGEFHSGSDIGAALGVSRTAVWKYMQRLADMGLSIESLKGKGYRLDNGVELLSSAKVSALLDAVTRETCSVIDVLMDTDSTNTVAMSRAAQGQTSGYVCLAEYQQAGRGRRGRQWVSPFGHNIYLSLVWEFDGGASQLEGLSLAVGVVIAQALSSLGLHDLSLKWPNDILLQKRKLGGILLEMSGDPAGLCQVVIGVGLNVRMPDTVNIDQPWAAVTQQVPHVSRNAVVAQLLNALIPMLREFSFEGFSPYRQAWEGLDAYRGQRVRVISTSREQEGVAQGVYDNGALRLAVGEQEIAIYGGEVSLRIADDS